MKSNIMKIRSYFLAFALASVFFACGDCALAADAADNAAADVPAIELAPGEFLPISVKLTNIGDKKKVQVLVNYEIQDESGKVFFRLSEFVPAENAISFVKNLQLPITMPSGQYFALSKINYADQEAPAISKFEFTVKRKFAGLFLDQLAILILIIIFAAVGFYVVSRLLAGRSGKHLARLDYPDVPLPDRAYFELISDIIAEARKKAGDKAIGLAAEIDGLVLDETDGRVLNLNKAPAEIAALLILKYEKAFKKKIKYQPRRSSREMKKELKFLEENLAIARKYFE